MNMLKDLEKLLSEIAEQQAAPRPRQQPQAARPIEPDVVEAQVVDAEIVPDAPRQRPRRRAEEQAAQRSPRRRSKTRAKEPAIPQVPEPPPAPEAALPGCSHDDFDQQLKQRDAQDGSRQETAPPGLNAAEIAQLFNEVGNVRRAIIMSEILNRPTHRW